MGVAPAEEAASRSRLLEALEALLPVSFEPREPAALRGLDAALIFADDDGAATGTLGWHGPRLVLRQPQSRSDAGTIEFAARPGVDQRLRGRALVDESPVAEVSPDDDVVLAVRQGRPLWLRRADGAWVDTLGTRPGELGADESLWDVISSRRRAGLLPLIHFLRDVSIDHAWRQPPLRASFVFDDPNLHWLSYGHLDYRELAREARVGGYHAAIATVPLDAWFVHPAAARQFRAYPELLSLVIHGNEHVRRELDRPTSEAEGIALLASALGRVRALERRSNAPVGRVVVPPHSVCSKPAFDAMLRLGIEAVVISDPYASWARRPHDSPLALLGPAELVSAGLPAIPRLHLSEVGGEAALRAFLDQPMVMYGHHEDVEHGLGVLRETATYLSALGDVRWMTLPRIARTNVATRIEGDVLAIRLFSSRLDMDIPSGVQGIRVEMPAIEDGAETTSVHIGGREVRLEPGPHWWTSEPVSVDPTDCVAVRLTTRPAVAPPASRRVRPWPVVRRLLTEGRDRARPAFRATRSAFAGPGGPRV